MKTIDVIVRTVRQLPNENVNITPTKNTGLRSGQRWIPGQTKRAIRCLEEVNTHVDMLQECQQSRSILSL